MMERGDSEPAHAGTRDRLASARRRSERKPCGTFHVHVIPRWTKADALRDVTGYGEPRRDIVLPNEGVRQVVANCT